MKICLHDKKKSKPEQPRIIEGHIYKQIDGLSQGSLYLCGSMGNGTFILINMESGARWRDPCPNPFNDSRFTFVDVTDEVCITRSK